MLDEYQLEQPIAYQIMKNAVIKEKLSHAYLMDIRNSINGDAIVLAFIKYLLCPDQRSDKQECRGCMQCKKIEDHNYTEIKIIEPDGLWIRKEQVDELQEIFSKKAIAGKYKIYVIRQVERLNQSAANSLLKFLEEPEPGIIAILTTDNVFQVLQTIRSRCQTLSLRGQQKDNKLEKTTMERLLEMVPDSSIIPYEKLEQIKTTVIQLIDRIEKKGIEALLHTQKLWHNVISEKNELAFSFHIITLFYHDVLGIKSGRAIEVFLEESALLHQIESYNTIQMCIQKIEAAMDLEKKIKFNVNQGLLIDMLVLALGGEDHG